jgi:hypothetical protein
MARIPIKKIMPKINARITIIVCKKNLLVYKQMKQFPQNPVAVRTVGTGIPALIHISKWFPRHCNYLRGLYI